MAININILEDGEGIEILCSGTILGKDVIALQQMEKTQKDFPPNFSYMLIDYSNVKESYVSVEEVDIIAGNDRKLLELLPHLVIAAVVPHDLFRSVSNLWIKKIYFESKFIKNFDNRAEAEAWIAKNKR